MNAIFCRVPFLSLGAVRAVCRRTRTLLSSPAFRKERLESGYAESGVVVAGGSRGGPTAECWLLAGGRWLPCAPMSGPHIDACSAVIDNELWVCGGQGGRGESVATVEVYSPATNTWRTMPALNERRSGAVCGVVGGSLVVAGGCNDGHGELTSAEACSPAAGRWDQIAPLPHTADAAMACVLNGRLFVAGGIDSDRLQMWDTKKWTLKAPMPAVRSEAASVVHEGKMTVIGGSVDDEAITSVILYDPQTDTWADGPPLPEPRRDCQAVEHAGAVILVGGGPSLRFKDGEWAELAEIPGGGAKYQASIGSVLLG